jgi:multiple sugar transport system permease protein
MSRAWRGAAIAAVLAIVVIALMPYLWIVLTSFKGRLEILSDRPVWTFDPTLEHYRGVFLDKKYLPLVWNSALVALGATILSLAIGVPAAYVFARSRFRGKEDLFFFFLTTRMAPAISVVVPMDLLLTSSASSTRGSSWCSRTPRSTCRSWCG